MHAGQVHREHPVPGVAVGLHERAAREAAHARHEHVDAAVPREHGVGEAGHGRAVRHIGGNQREPRRLGGGYARDQPRPLRLDHVGDPHVRAVGEEPQAHGLAQGAGAAGDDGRAVGDGHSAAGMAMMAERWTSS